MVKKHTLDCSNELWKRMLLYKAVQGFKNVNEAMIDVLDKHLPPLPPQTNYEQLPKKARKTHTLTPDRARRIQEDLRRKLE